MRKDPASKSFATSRRRMIYNFDKRVAQDYELILPVLQDAHLSDHEFDTHTSTLHK